MTFIKILNLSFLLGICFFSCKDNSVVTVSQTPKLPSFENAFFPLAVGNSWTYTDSLFSETTITVDSFTVSIIAVRSDSTGTWYDFHTEPSWAYWFHTSLKEQNDSVYSLQYAWSYFVEGLEYIPPSDSEMTYFEGMVGGDISIEKSVFRLRQPYSTPTGLFDSCAHYYYDLFEGHITEVVCPKIGLVGYGYKLDAVDSPGYSHPGFIRKVSLTRYNLVR